MILPGLQGPAKKQFFNGIATSLLLVMAVSGGIMGTVFLGPLGALVGIAVGMTGGARLLSGERYFR